MQGVVQVVREVLRGGGSSGAFTTWYEYSLYIRDEKQGRQYRVRAAGRWEDMDLVEETEIWNEGLGTYSRNSYRESIRKLWLSNTLQHGFKSQEVWQLLLCTFYCKIILFSQCHLLLH